MSPESGIKSVLLIVTLALARLQCADACDVHTEHSKVSSEILMPGNVWLGRIPSLQMVLHKENLITLMIISVFQTSNHNSWAWFSISTEGPSNLWIGGRFEDAKTIVKGFSLQNTCFPTQPYLVTKTTPTISRNLGQMVLTAVYNVKLGSIVKDAQQVFLSRGLENILYNDTEEITVYGETIINASLRNCLNMVNNIVSLPLEISVNCNATALEVLILAPTEYLFQHVTGDGRIEDSFPHSVKTVFPMTPGVFSTSTACFTWQVYERPGFLETVIYFVVGGIATGVIGVIIGVLLEGRLKRLFRRLKPLHFLV